MKHPRDPNLAPKATPPPPPERDISDLVELKAIAASTRASATAPVVSAAALSGVVARRDSVVGARVTDGSSGIPPWFWGVIGCLGVMALGLGVFWYVNAPVRPSSLVAVPTGVPSRPPPRWPVTPAPQIVPIPPALPSVVEPERPEKEKATTHPGTGKSAAHTTTAGAGVRDEAADDVTETPQKPAVRDAQLPAATDGVGGGEGDKRRPRASAGPAGDTAGGATDRARKDVDNALEDLQPKVRECFRRFQIRGIALVKLTISANGSVKSPALTGDFEGTPTGECVINELTSAALPSFKGGPVNVSHAYVFR